MSIDSVTHSNITSSMHRILIADDTEGDMQRRWIALYDAFPDTWLSPWKYKLIKIEEDSDQFLELKEATGRSVCKFGSGEWMERPYDAASEEVSLDGFIFVVEGSDGEVAYSGRKHLEDNHGVCPKKKISRTGDGVVTVQANSKSFICIHKTRLVAP
jgi:hypothetical protein